MKKVWKKLPALLIVLCLLSSSAMAQVLNTDKLATPLLQQLADKPQDVHSVYVLLKDRLPVRALEKELIARGASLEERAVEVVTQLKAKATATQPSFIRELKAMPGLRAETIHPFWITNLLFFEADAAAIAKLSHHAAVDMIFLNGEVKLDATSVVEEYLPPVPGGTEAGLRAIGAPQMWAMGYTGYGRKALVVDTGQDPSHPALKVQYAGHNIPAAQAWAAGSDPQDCGRHGTHVMGTILGLDRIEQDTIGVAFNAQWLGAPALCGGSVSNLNTTESFQWALDPDGNSETTDDIPDVINNSWWSPQDPDCGGELIDLYDALYAAGIAVVFSAGNEGPGTSTITPPKANNWDLVRLFSVGNLNGNSASLPISGSSSRGPSVCGGEGSLLIKPEVSAPGTGIRSCVPDGEYSSLSGTSMAAPHVSGAVLLLKEAFPYLSGEELLLALYFSAIDLGAEGEDNTYGMGIINVPAAFRYLTEQGHVPVSPLTAENDVVLLAVNTPELNCEETIAPRIEVLNNGRETVEKLDVIYLLRDQAGEVASYPYSWQGQIAAGEQRSIVLPGQSLPVGEYELEVSLLSVNGQADARQLDNRQRSRVRLSDKEQYEATLAGASYPVCQNGQALIKSSYPGQGTVRWYDAPEGGELVAEGRSVLLDMEGSSQTLYAQLSPIEKTGRPNNEGAGQEYSNETEGLLFDALTDFTLRSVKVYAEERGGRLFQLVKPDGNPVTRLAFLEEGEQRLELNLEIEAGEGYRLELRGGKPLGISLSGGYPYVIPDVLSIKRASTNSLLQYYYFYDWEVEYDYPCGRSPVEIEVSAAESSARAAFSPTNTSIGLSSGFNEVGFTDESTGARSWLWDFGDGNVSSAQHPSHFYTDTGTYQVRLTILTYEGCTSSTEGVVEVTESDVVSVKDVQEKLGLRVFPNPAQDLLYLAVTTAQPIEADLYLVDMLGRQVMHRRTEIADGQVVELSVNKLPEGIYWLSFVPRPYGLPAGASAQVGSQGKKLVKKLIIAR